jgi:hypothetical protein
MSTRFVAIALTSLAAIACGGDQLLSPPSTWGGDFTDRSPPTDQCPGGTVTQLRTRMAVSTPQNLSELMPRLPDSVRSRISSEDTLHSFQFSTDPDSGNFWGFGGYLVAHGDCIVHARITSHDN